MMRSAWACSMLLASASVFAVDITEARYTCKQGNCRNGNAVVWDPVYGVEIRGNFVGGKTIAGETYVVTVPSKPERKFEQIFGEDGYLVSGSQPRAGSISNNALPVFTGSFGRIEHTFVNATIPTFNEGVYETGLGFEYHGRFQFMPAADPYRSQQAAGYYIFFGEFIDREENEHETGLFVSDIMFPGSGATFYKASPGYLAEMQERYQRNLHITKKEDAERAQRESRWKSILGMVGQIAMNYAAGSVGGSLGGSSPLGGLSLGGSSLGGGAGDIGGRIAMNLVSSMMSGKDSGMTVGDFTRSVIGSVVADQGAGGAIANSLLNSASNSGGSGGGVGGSLVSALGAAAIAQTGGVVSSAIAGADSGVGGQVVGALTQGVFNNLAKGAAGAASANDGFATSAASPPSPLGSAVVNTVASATIARTGSIVGAAVAGSDSGVTGQVLGAVTQNVFNGLARSAATSSASNVGSAASAVTPVSPPVDDQAVKGLQAMSAMASAAKTASKVEATPATVTPEPVLVPRIPTPPILPAPREPTHQMTASFPGRVAYFEKIAPPDNTSFASGRPFATNDGLYVRLSANAGGTIAGKYTLGRGTRSRWLQGDISKGVGTFDVGALFDEEIDSLNVKYIDPNGGQYRFGRWATNFAGVKSSFELDLGARVTHFVPVGHKQTYGASWAIGRGAVFHEIMSRSSETKFSAIYDEIPVANIQSDLFVSHEDGMSIFIAGSDLQSVVQVSSDKTIRRFDLRSFGGGTVNTLIHAFDTLWIGYGAQVIALTGSKLTPFTQIPGLLPTHTQTFCLAGAVMYLANGEVIRDISAAPQAPAAFLQNGKPPEDAEEMQKLIELKSALGVGIYCAAEQGFGQHVYALAPDQKSGDLRIYKIVPNGG